VFRIFHEIHAAQTEGLKLDIAFMIDQSHNLKGKMEAMVQTVVTAQEIWVKAALVDREELSTLQTRCELVQAEETFRGSFWHDVRPMVAAWRESRRIPADPLAALRESGYVERITRERGSRAVGVASYA
jgi:L-rhamnose isomerase/sugar isomerase